MSIPQSAHVRLFTADLPSQEDWPRWYYQDRHGGLQGPFDAATMSRWCGENALPLDLKCASIHPLDRGVPKFANFQPLQKLLDNAEGGVRYTPLLVTKGTLSNEGPATPQSAPAKGSRLGPPAYQGGQQQPLPAAADVTRAVDQRSAGATPDLTAQQLHMPGQGLLHQLQQNTQNCLVKGATSGDIHSFSDLQLQPLEDLQQSAEAVVQDAVALYITLLKKEARSFNLGVKFQQQKDLGKIPQHIISAAPGFTAKYDVPTDFLQQKQQQIDAAVLRCRKTLQDISLELIAEQLEGAKAAAAAAAPSRSKAILMAPFEVVPETYLDKPYIAKIINQQQVLFDWKLHAAKKALALQLQGQASKQQQQQQQANDDAVTIESGPVTMQQQVNEAVAAALKSQLTAALAAAGITSSSCW